MNLDIKVFLIEKLLSVPGIENQYLNRVVMYENSDKKVDVDTLQMTAFEVKTLAKFHEDYYHKHVPDKTDIPTHNKYYSFLNVSRKLSRSVDLRNSDNTGGKIKKLEEIPIAFKTFFNKYPHKVVFLKGSDGIDLPWTVTDIEFTKARRNRDYKEPAYASIDIAAKVGNDKRTKTHNWESAGYTCLELLKQAGFRVEDDESIKNYVQDFVKYKEYCVKLGTQVYGVEETKDGRPLIVDGKKTKLVIDDTEQKGVKKLESNTFYNTFFKDQDIEIISCFAHLLEDKEEDEADSMSPNCAYPIHPYIDCFRIEKHDSVDVHIRNIEDYPWDHNLADKLILDQETKDLVEILVDSTKERAEDIISGKMSGTIVLATGLPGVGKTLTAEVFSEKIEKPLYVVQCSQLGIKVDTIESNLKDTLSRASRWGAILLIDEADVYIRDRGSDIVHNAIVGVFLRLIEYYNGIMFMTSNRGDIIDDAIISRATAWIQYQLPNEDLLKEIWKVLSTQFKIDLGDKEIKELVNEIPNISGRTVRNLLKLVSTLDYEKPKDSKQLQVSNKNNLIKVSKFQKLDQAGKA